jgi:hypothetical protein
MFFSLTYCTKLNFSTRYELGKLNLYTDQGWHCKKVDGVTTVYKGYADEFDLAENLSLVINQSTPIFTGNFCAICYEHSSGRVFIKSDVWRSFPIFIHENEITNLVPDKKVAWADSIVLVDQEFNIVEEKFDVIGKISTDRLSSDDALNQINNILSEKTQKFLSHNVLPIKVHLSGGVDSLLVYSLLKNSSSNYEIIKSGHFDYDKFWLLNDTQIKTNFWGYNQIHHWNDPCVLTSGAPGDEFMLRSPVTIDMLLKYRGFSILEILEENKNILHNDYFRKQKHMEIFKNQQIDQTLSINEFYWNLCNIVVNDWQHWHIGNTLTWTPLRDLEIFKIMLRLDEDDAISQILNSTISVQLIEKNAPGLSMLMSDQKNSANPMKNLIGFLFDDVV